MSSPNAQNLTLRTTSKTILKRVEPSAPYTELQKDAAERSGGVLRDETRTMAIGENFSMSLWSEI